MGYEREKRKKQEEGKTHYTAIETDLCIAITNTRDNRRKRRHWLLEGQESFIASKTKTNSLRIRPEDLYRNRKQPDRENQITRTIDSTYISILITRCPSPALGHHTRPSHKFHPPGSIMEKVQLHRF
jgi:hypothetical protein